MIENHQIFIEIGHLKSQTFCFFASYRYTSVFSHRPYENLSKNAETTTAPRAGLLVTEVSQVPSWSPRCLSWSAGHRWWGASAGLLVTDGGVPQLVCWSQMVPQLVCWSQTGASAGLLVTDGWMPQLVYWHHRLIQLKSAQLYTATGSHHSP